MAVPWLTLWLAPIRNRLGRFPIYRFGIIARLADKYPSQRELRELRATRAVVDWTAA